MKKVLMSAIILLSAGCSHMMQQKNQTLHYQCGTTPLTVTLNAKTSTASFLMDGEQLQLKQVAAASGTRYSDGKYVFWSKGQSAWVERHDRVIMSDCTVIQ
ncbi:lipoprotein [Chania multitudinisentens RB-25]|uniref:Lipoprotein n=1 Tax=Chania multitudinisentens RB-25 TaxID=1441930 RepID=W0LFA5_9GAMM|nr:MliC family protein [Chania multitudinisentens]AHG22396.1 lipoprotein [Chania multitudinisentens RB-25]